MIKHKAEKPSHRFYADNFSLVTDLESIDTTGEDVYFCTASLTGRRRLGELVHSLKAFRLDADVKPGAYASQAEAARAVASVLASLGLLPTWVNSGNGLHCYIVLDEAIPPAVWLPAATVLSEHCRSAGLALDHAVTTDLVRILRYPGTFNRKAEPKPVELWGEIRLNETKAVLAALAGAARSTLSPPPAGLSRPTRPAGGFLGDMHGAAPPASAALAAQHCRQLADMRDNRQARSGCWYPLIGVLAWCEDGDALAQEWSSAHETYTEAETSEKLDRVRAKTTGGTTCATLEKHWPQGCEGCLHKGRITSPVQLGRAAATGQAAGAPSGQAGEPPSDIPKAPWPFKTDGRGVYYLESEGEDAKIAHIYTRPLFLARMTKSELGNGLGSVFRHKATKGWEEFQIPNHVLVSREARGAFARFIPAFPESNWRAMAVYISSAQNHLEPQGYISLYDQFGFKPAGFSNPDLITSFVLGETEYLADGSQRLAALNENLRNRAALMQTRGTREAWVKAAHKFVAPGMEPHMLTIMLALAAPLICLTGGDGAVLCHGYSPETATGKTFAAFVALSMWGSEQAFTVVSSDTENARNRFVSQAGNLPIYWDEFTLQDPDIAERIVMDFTLGREKRRSQRDGSLMQIENTWNNLILTSGNRSLRDMLGLAKSGSDDAAAARVFEYAVTPSIYSQSEMLAVVRECRQNCGHIGREFIAAVVQKLSFVQAALDARIKEYQALPGFGPECRYQVRTLAALDITMRIAQGLNFFQFTPDRYMQFAIGQVNEAAAERLSLKANTNPLGRFLAENQDKILVVPEKWQNRDRFYQVPILLPRGKLYARIERDSNRIYIDKSFFDSWLLEKKFDKRSVLHKFKIDKVLQGEKMMTLSAGVRELQVAFARVYIFDGLNPVVAGVVEGNIVAMMPPEPKLKVAK
jgi:hypothetical protein